MHYNLYGRLVNIIDGGRKETGIENGFSADKDKCG